VVHPCDISSAEGLISFDLSALIKEGFQPTRVHPPSFKYLPSIARRLNMTTQTPICVYINCAPELIEKKEVIENALIDNGCEVDFGLRHYDSTVKIIPELSNSADKADFALFLLDRDYANLDFEYGYFCSRLGIGRVALIVNSHFETFTKFNRNLLPKRFVIDTNKEAETEFERDKRRDLIERLIDQYNKAWKNLLEKNYKQRLNEELFSELMDEIDNFEDDIEMCSDEGESESSSVKQVWTDIIPSILGLIKEKGKKILSVKPKVFISYNHQDSEIAEKIKGYLEAKGIQVTIDKEMLGASEDITKFIYRCIRDNDVIISIVSTRSLQSAWVGQESINSLVAENVDDKYFIACRIDDDYTRDKFLIGEIKKIKDLIQTKELEREELAALDVDTAYIDREISRFKDLKNNLPKILRKLTEAKTINLAGNEYEKGMENVVATIRKVVLEKQRT
jgi:hypothetical protein